ncbi:MAG: fused MFS/spermidine synthase [Nocardioides sp.]|uniref:spermidine synthase n=1 Tax=Nocardioides sp. TaxID=35761 RepID=UPI0039E3258A
MPRWRLEVLVFLVGAGTLGAEIAAARLLAPWFGASTIVWANTIAIVLVALAVGYAVGGRLADRRPHPPLLAGIVLVASVLLAIVPLVSGPFLRAAVSAVDQLSVATFLGSLVGVGALVAVPLLLLGMVSPFALRLRLAAVDDPAQAGRTAGRLSAIGTVGSLTGTFAASLLLIPVVGTRRTFLVFAALMALAAVPLVVGRVRWAAVLVPVAILGLIALPAGSVKSEISGGRVIWEAETEYQYARVIERSDRSRWLELNEGHAVHSVYRPGAWLTGGYWDEMLGLTLAGGRTPSSVAILGSAAGTTARQLGHYLPATRVDAVEIDPVVTSVGRSLFDLSGPSLVTHDADARPWLAASTQRFDVILVDAYRQPYIPFYLTTQEFFSSVRSHLAPSGVLILNSAHPEGSDTLEKALSATLRSVFGPSSVWRNPAQPTNSQLVATVGVSPVEGLASVTAPSDLSSLVDSIASRLEPALAGGSVWTDDRAPVEWLTDLSLAGEID